MPLTKEERSKKSKEAWARKRAKEEEIKLRKFCDTLEFIESLGEEGRETVLFNLFYTYGLLDLERGLVILREEEYSYDVEYSEVEVTIAELLKCPLP